MTWAETGLAAGVLYAVFREQGTGQVYQTTTETLVPEVAANRANYDVALTETPAGGYTYQLQVPAALPAGHYLPTAYLRLGGAPAAGDPAVYEWAPFAWDGVGEISPGATLGELAGLPPAEPTQQEALMLLYMLARNARLENGILEQIHNDAGEAILERDILFNESVLNASKVREPAP
jgi:hypothetical protein